MTLLSLSQHRRRCHRLRPHRFRSRRHHRRRRVCRHHHPSITINISIPNHCFVKGFESAPDGKKFFMTNYRFTSCHMNGLE